MITPGTIPTIWGGGVYLKGVPKTSFKEKEFLSVLFPEPRVPVKDFGKKEALEERRRREPSAQERQRRWEAAEETTGPAVERCPSLRPVLALWGRCC